MFGLRNYDLESDESGKVMESTTLSLDPRELPMQQGESLEVKVELGTWRKNHRFSGKDIQRDKYCVEISTPHYMIGVFETSKEDAIGDYNRVVETLIEGKEYQFKVNSHGQLSIHPK